jgi:RNA-directed DNA polymerase
VYGLGIEQIAELLRMRWNEIRQALLAGKYRPQPVRKVMIPNRTGASASWASPRCWIG